MTPEELEADGWSRLPTEKFSAAIGPSWVRYDEALPMVAMLAGEAVTNENIGIVHGGALLTFADIAFGVAVADALGLQFHFTAAARVGSLITCQPEVVRKTSQLVFVRGLFMADGRVVGSADGIFKVLEPDKLAGLRASA